MSARGFAAADGGQAIVLIALAMTTLLLGVGLAIDTGTLFVARRTAQSAADAAAWAGAVVIYKGGTAASGISAATTDATQNGFTNGVSSTTVSVSSPPTSGEWSGDTRFVQVTLTRDVRTIFLQGAASALTRIEVHAVAGAAPTSKGYAILVLGSSGTALSVTGGGSGGGITVAGGDVLVNSSDSTSAIRTTGGGTLTVTSPDTVSVVGGYSGSGFSPAPTTGAQGASDPFAAMPEPSATTCAAYGGCATVRATNLSVNDTRIISPGIYDGGISVQASANLTLGPGVYIMKNGGFKVSGGAAVAVSGTGSGVTIFNTTANYPLSTGNCGDISISGGGTITLWAPTTGVYKGMLIWQDPDCGTNPSNAMTISGTTSVTALTGTFYVPNNTVSISGAASGSALNSQIIANELSVSGSATINLTYNENTSAQPLLPALVE
jgi:hypothetical protein